MSVPHKKYKPIRLLTGVSCLERGTKVSATSLSLSAPLRSPWNFWEQEQNNADISTQTKESDSRQESNIWPRLPNTGQVLYPLSYDNLWRTRSCNWVHMWQASCIPLKSALLKSPWKWYECPLFVSCWSVHSLHFITDLKIHHLYLYVTIMMTSIVLILAVCRTPVTHELSYMTLFFEAQWILGSRPVFRRPWVWFLSGTQLFSLSYVHVMLISSLFTFSNRLNKVNHYVIDH